MSLLFSAIYLYLTQKLSLALHTIAMSKFPSLFEYFSHRPRLATQRAIARRVNVTQTYMSMLARAPWRKPARPSLDLACRIGLATGGAVSPYALAGYPEPEDPNTSPPGE
jgi:hypothetical protein